jgi:hypothetical protein
VFGKKQLAGLYGFRLIFQRIGLLMFARWNLSQPFSSGSAQQEQESRQ